MGKRIPEVTAYIDKQPDFARPILKKIRTLVHKTCPKVEESIKWGWPFFSYEGPFLSISAFKAHVSFGFWKAVLMKDPNKIFDNAKGQSMCSTRVATLKDLPSDKIMSAYIKEAMVLNETGAKLPRKKAVKKKVDELPEDLAKALKLKKNAKAKATFEAFPPSHQREYIQWITEAKREETRAKRLATALEWMAEGKPRNWKYTPQKQSKKKTAKKKSAKKKK